MPLPRRLRALSIQVSARLFSVAAQGAPAHPIWTNNHPNQLTNQPNNRSIYGECISSYPLNGGSYSLLLNTSTKAVAALGACLSVIAYVATGVVSAVTASNYLETVLSGIDVQSTACLLLLAFAIVVVLGLRESANVALVICCAHVATLLLLLGLGLLYVLSNSAGELIVNMAQPFPDITVRDRAVAHDVQGGCMYEPSAHNTHIRQTQPPLSLHQQNKTERGRRHRGRLRHGAALRVRGRHARRVRL